MVAATSSYAMLIGMSQQQHDSIMVTTTSCYAMFIGISQQQHDSNMVTTWSQPLPARVFTTFVYSKFCIFRMFFLFRIPFENGPYFAKLYEIFLCKSIQNSAVFREILWLVMPIFLTIQHRRHFLHTAEKLQDADWGLGRYNSTPLNPYPFTAASRVFTTFRILEISYISNVFFCFVYHSKIYFSDPDSSFNEYLCKITIFPVFWRLNCKLCNVLITIPFVPFLSFCLLLFLYSINTKYSPRFQRHLLLVKFLFEGIQNFVWKSCQIIRNVV